MVSTRSSAGGEASPLLVEEAGVSAKTHGSIFGATPRRALAAIAAGAVFVFACVAFAARGGHFGVNDQLKSGFSRTGPVTDLNLANLPDVDFTGKTLLIVLGMSFSGTSALEGLLGTSVVIADLCKADTWQCENTQLLQNLGFKNPNADCDCCEDEYTSVSDVTAAEYAYAYRDFANKWWDMSKPVLMDKTPNMLCRHRFVRDAAAALGVPVKFVVLTHNPFSWNSESHPFNEDYYAENLAYTLDVLADSSVDSLQVRYEDMAWNMDEVIKSIKAFVPAVKNLNPWHSSLSDDSKGDRGMGVRVLPARAAGVDREGPGAGDVRHAVQARVQRGRGVRCVGWREREPQRVRGDGRVDR